MAVSDVTGKSQALNDQYPRQTEAVPNNSEMSMDDFWQLMAAQLQYQDMTNPMSNSEMMNQMTQMATMNAMTQVSEAIANFGVVTNNLSQVTLTTYSTGMIGRGVTVATVDSTGKVTGEKTGVVTGVDLTGGQFVYIDGEKYSLSQIMSVGEVPKKEDGDTPDVEEPEKPDTDNPEVEKPETENPEAEKPETPEGEES